MPPKREVDTRKPEKENEVLLPPDDMGGQEH